MRLILLGPPGAGKGTQAKLLSQKFNIPHISTGDILRDEMRQDSKLGRKVQGFVQKGELVPDDIVVEVVMNRLKKNDAAGSFILDGFPRTLNQANKLTKRLKRLNITVDLVIYLATHPQVSIRRLCGRRVCKVCGANFHLVNMLPKKQGICDFCQGELYLRDDDRKETIKKRLAVYQRQTANLIEYYKKVGSLRKVSGDLEADQVNAQLEDLFTQENLTGSSK